MSARTTAAPAAPGGGRSATSIWLRGQPSLADVAEYYPDDYASVQRQLSAALDAGGAEAVAAYVQRLRSPERRRHPAAELREYIAAALVRQLSLAAATGVTSGTVRFGQRDGRIAQRLLFDHDLVRKPVSMRAFRALWPLVRQKDFLMPLVEPKGIYCFYSRELVAQLVTLIDGRSCLEIAAGDGTLSRFLGDRGAAVTATDDHSWQQHITYDPAVVREDARTALGSRRPQVVICSWPPAGNPFESGIFTTPSVELYVMIGSRSEFASGNWASYRAQHAFDMAEAPALSALVLPPELDCAVYLFRRRDAGSAAEPA